MQYSWQITRATTRLFTLWNDTDYSDSLAAALLYVTCNLKPTELSRSLSIGKEFLDEYLRQNPDDEVHLLDLYRDNIQRIDADVLGGWGKMRNGESFASLSTDEQSKVGRIWNGNHIHSGISVDPEHAPDLWDRRSS